MFKVILAITLCTLLFASISYADGWEEIEIMCTENWGSDLEMRDLCIDNQQRAAELCSKIISKNM